MKKIVKMFLVICVMISFSLSVFAVGGSRHGTLVPHVAGQEDQRVISSGSHSYSLGVSNVNFSGLPSGSFPATPTSASIRMVLYGNDGVVYVTSNFRSVRTSKGTYRLPGQRTITCEIENQYNISCTASWAWDMG